MSAVLKTLGGFSSFQWLLTGATGAMLVNWRMSAQAELQDNFETQVYGYPLRMEEEVKALAAMAATQRAADKNFEESQREQAAGQMKSKFFPVKN